MALNKVQLKNGIRSLTDDLFENTAENTPEECREIFSTRLSDLIDQFVKTGLVTVTTTGTATNHTGTGSIS